MFKRFLLGPVLTLLLSSAWAGEVLLQAASDDWCPYVCRQSPEGGFGPALLKRIAQQAGWRLEFHWMPFTRVRELAQQGKLDVVPFVSSEDGLVLVEPVIFHVRACFFTRPNNPWRFTGAASLTQIRLGILLGYQLEVSQDVALQASFERLKREGHLDEASGENPEYKNLLKLMTGRVNVALADRNSMRWTAHEHELKVRSAGCLPDKLPQYFGLSPLLPLSQRMVWEAAQRKVVASGAVQQLARRYGIQLN